MAAVLYYGGQTEITPDAESRRTGRRPGATIPPKDRAKNRLLRLLACAAVGVAMAGTTYVCAYRGMRHASPFEDRHRGAFQSVIHLKGVLEDFHKEKGRYPERLAALNGGLPEYLQPDSSGQILDPWKHPYEYRSDGQSYTLRSLGIDGQPGGPGLARDVDAREIILEEGSYPFRYHVRPTFWQYTFDLETTKPTMLVCALAGVFASVACFVTPRDRRLGLGGTIGSLLGTLLACFVVTMLIAILHTPSHH
jgi:general secretion pathway protein G